MPRRIPKLFRGKGPGELSAPFAPDWASDAELLAADAEPRSPHAAPQAPDIALPAPDALSPARDAGDEGSSDPAVDDASRRARASIRRRLVVVAAGVAVGVLIVGGLALAGAIWEMQTSALQARWLVPIASDLTWTVEPGESTSAVFPGDGPYDRRLGYTRIPEMTRAAATGGFRVVEQARVSSRFRDLVDRWGLFPIYHEKTQAGLTILGKSGETLLGAAYPERIYPTFESIPPVVWQTLLFIENRAMLDPDQPLQNPAVEWPRLIRSTADLALRELGREGNVSGASTLATQVEKFRHASQGLTTSPRDKLVQMARQRSARTRRGRRPWRHAGRSSSTS